MNKKEKGITLIALIVSIIIIIILAAVTANILVSTGLIDKGIEAAKKYQGAQYNEIDEIDKILKSIGGTENKEILMPSVEYAKPEGENGWYKSNIEIEVTSENTDNITNFAYKLTDKKGNKIEESSDLNKEGDTIIIEKDGEYILAVWAENDKNERSEIKVIENLKKDAAGPQGLALSLDEANIGETEIPVTASITKSVSGIAEYEFYIKEAGSTTYTVRNVAGFTSGDDDKYTQNVGETQTHTYTGLAAGKEYQMYVKVKDKAGTWVSTEDAVSTGTTEGGEIILTANNLATYLGKYVNYTPDEGSYTATVANGAYEVDQTFTTYTGTDESKKLQWRIWNIEGDKLTLISDKQIQAGGYNDEGTLYLGGGDADHGATAYNNGVAMLNLICKNCYSNNSMNAVGRSMSLDDILAVKSNSIYHSTDGRKALAINYVYTYSGHQFPTVWINNENKTNYADTRDSLKVKSEDYGMNLYTKARDITSDYKLYLNLWKNGSMNNANAWSTPVGVAEENSYWKMVLGPASIRLYWLASRFGATGVANYGQFRLANGI